MFLFFFWWAVDHMISCGFFFLLPPTWLFNLPPSACPCLPPSLLNRKCLLPTYRESWKGCRWSWGWVTEAIGRVSRQPEALGKAEVFFPWQAGNGTAKYLRTFVVESKLRFSPKRGTCPSLGTLGGSSRGRVAGDCLTCSCHCEWLGKLNPN